LLHQFPEKLSDSVQWMPPWAGACWPILFLFLIIEYINK
jgi:hypothetical protein